MQPDRLIRQAELNQFDGLKHTQRDEAVKKGKYPPPAKILEGGRAKAWFGSEIAAYQRWRKADRDGTAAEGSSWKDYLEGAEQ
jgi:predicted DNA-binding transcriptional regulator AlpA